MILKKLQTDYKFLCNNSCDTIDTVLKSGYLMIIKDTQFMSHGIYILVVETKNKQEKLNL